MADSKWSNAFLDAKRNEADELGDRTIEIVVQQGEVEDLNRLFWRLVSEDQIPTAEEIPALAEFMEKSATLPRWADEKLIERGENVFDEWGLLSIVILGSASLPECYVNRTIAEVLGITQQLADHTERRVLETAQMVLDVMRPGGIVGSSTRRGVLAAQKVRLMHAAVRHLILDHRRPDSHAPGDTKLAGRFLDLHWDEATKGKPINQEDLVYTLLTFSHVILRGWKDLGIDLSEEDQTAYVHCWNVIGHVMGIGDDLLPLGGAEEAAHLFELIKGRQEACTEDGVQLTHSLIALMKKVNPPPHIITNRLPRMMMHTLLGDETCDLLGVRKLTFVDRHAVGPLRGIARTVDFLRGRARKDVPGSARVASMVSQWLLRRLFALPRLGNRQPFRVPEKLPDR